MALKYGDRVQETVTTTGTGTYSLGGAVTGYQTFSSVLSNSDTCYYAATDGTNWEVGKGTYTSSGNTLARTTILASSNSGSAVSWSAGTKNIWLDIPASWYNSPLLKGVTDGSDAAAGIVGEFLSANVQSTSAVSLVSGTAKTVTSLSLTAGDWDVWALAGFHPVAGSTNANNLAAGLSTTTNTLPSEPWLGGYASLGIVNQLTSGDYNLAIPSIRVNISSTTTYYLVEQCAFSSSTMGGYGAIMARRRR